LPAAMFATWKRPRARVIDKLLWRWKPSPTRCGKRSARTRRPWEAWTRSHSPVASAKTQQRYASAVAAAWSFSASASTQPGIAARATA
jgi:hypothetical protein